jgi:hypothetical protein
MTRVQSNTPITRIRFVASKSPTKHTRFVAFDNQFLHVKVTPVEVAPVEVAPVNNDRKVLPFNNDPKVVERASWYHSLRKEYDNYRKDVAIDKAVTVTSCYRVVAEEETKNRFHRNEIKWLRDALDHEQWKHQDYKDRSLRELPRLTVVSLVLNVVFAGILAWFNR